MNAQGAIYILREELKKRGMLYAGFHASIVSALNEAKPYMGETVLATKILDRLIGDEEDECR